MSDLGQQSLWKRGVERLSGGGPFKFVSTAGKDGAYFDY